MNRGLFVHISCYGVVILTRFQQQRKESKSLSVKNISRVEKVQCVSLILCTQTSCDFCIANPEVSFRSRNLINNIHITWAEVDEIVLHELSAKYHPLPDRTWVERDEESSQRWPRHECWGWKGHVRLMQVCVCQTNSDAQMSAVDAFGWRHYRTCMSNWCYFRWLVLRTWQAMLDGSMIRDVDYNPNPVKRSRKWIEWTAG